MKILSYISVFMMCLAVSSCEMDIIPKGQSTLSNTSELELLLNCKTIGERPYESLGIIVNEDYGREYSSVEEQIKAGQTMGAINLTYNEDIDRGELASDDDKYTDIYSYVNYMNVLLSQIDGASGNDDRKDMIKAEAKITRGYYLFIASNIYAKQYDDATAEMNGGIAYPETPDIDTKPQLTLKECYNKILEDCSDENIGRLLDKGNVNRITKATGNAIKAVVLFQMKHYEEALPYAEKALSLNSNIEDRSLIVYTKKWTLLPSSENNLLYISPLFDMTYNPTWEQLSAETSKLFEDGDFVKDYATSGSRSYWDSGWGEMDSGIKGCLEATGYDAYVNPWGITVEQIMYLAAECHIRKGQIQKGLDLVNKVRSFRIHTDFYRPFTASTEENAMDLLQRAKFIENIGTCWNFFDRKRWNTEDKYRKTITRDLQDAGSYSISPDSKLWVFPFPLRVMQNNSTFKQNYE